MSTLSLLGAVEALRARGQLPTRYVQIGDLLNRFQPAPANSVRALVSKMFDSVPGIDYRVVPIFWGPTFPPQHSADFTSEPYSPQQFVDALNRVADAGYFSLLNQYGAKSIGVTGAAGFDDPWPAGNGYYVSVFTDGDIVSIIQRHVGSQSVPLPGEGLRPIYLVIIPHGSLRDSHALGAHSAFPFHGENLIWAWMYGSPNLSAAINIATHEIAEAVGADGGSPKELSDDCKDEFPDGWKTVDGLSVETYYDAYTGRCVAPGCIRP